jgi:hypothetical protein
MPKLITTITKKSNHEWFDYTVPGFFTQNEIDTIVQPYIDHLKSFPGYLNYQKQYDGDTLTITRTFDTVENARNFLNNFESAANPIIGKFNNLLRVRNQENGIEESFNIRYEK